MPGPQARLRVRLRVSGYATRGFAVAPGKSRAKNSRVFRFRGETMHGTLALPSADLALHAFARRPLRSADDLRRAVLEQRGSPLRVDACGLDRVLRLDPAGDRIEAQSATTWRALAAYAADTAPELARFAQDTWLPPTIGQSLAKNAPGPDGHPLIAHIDAVALVTPDGQLRRASRSADSELFALAVGGYGAFGAPYSVTLRLSSLVRCAAAATPVAMFFRIP